MCRTRSDKKVFRDLQRKLITWGRSYCERDNLFRYRDRRYAHAHVLFSHSKLLFDSFQNLCYIYIDEMEKGPHLRNYFSAQTNHQRAIGYK